MSRFFRQFALFAVVHLLLAVLVVGGGATWIRQRLEQQLAGEAEEACRLAKVLLERGNLAGSPEKTLVAFDDLARGGSWRLSLLTPRGTPWPEVSEGEDSGRVFQRGGEEFEEAKERPLGTARRFDAETGEEWLYVATRVSAPAEIGFVRVEVPLASIDSAWRAAWWSLLGGVLAFTVLAAVAAYWPAFRVALPLVRIAEGAQAIAAGDYGREVSPASPGELNVVTDAFSQIQAELSRRLNQLRENNAQLATVLGGMIEGVVALDAEQRILLANEASLNLLDCVQRNVVGRPLLEVCRYRAVNDALQRALRGDAPARVEFETPGTVRRVLSLRAAQLPGDPCPGTVLVVHDVTDLRRLENLRREFVANVSHELKTPLASIKAYAETLRLGALDDKEHNLAFVLRIEEQAERLYQLIMDMLHLARVESGQEAFEIIEVPLASAIEFCAANHADAATAKNITLALEAPATPLAVKADEDGLQIILENLVNNALKYTPAGGKVIIRWLSEGSQAVIEVEDTGIGVAPKDQARVFERFFRVDKARSRELGGTGLGLSIVKHLAQAFGGGVGLESRLGQGSTFRVRLPLADS